MCFLATSLYTLSSTVQQGRTKPKIIVDRHSWGVSAAIGHIPVERNGWAGCRKWGHGGHSVVRRVGASTENGLFRRPLLSNTGPVLTVNISG